MPVAGRAAIKDDPRAAGFWILYHIEVVIWLGWRSPILIAPFNKLKGRALREAQEHGICQVGFMEVCLSRYCKFATRWLCCRIELKSENYMGDLSLGRSRKTFLTKKAISKRR